nr:MAG TPA_asm: hypothetical protein [Bacteriophage sp.]
MRTIENTIGVFFIPFLHRSGRSRRMQAVSQ